LLTANIVSNFVAAETEIAAMQKPRESSLFFMIEGLFIV
jgi:hypothetical protein